MAMASSSAGFSAETELQELTNCLRTTVSQRYRLWRQLAPRTTAPSILMRSCWMVRPVLGSILSSRIHSAHLIPYIFTVTTSLSSGKAQATSTLLWLGSWISPTLFDVTRPCSMALLLRHLVGQSLASKPTTPVLGLCTATSFGMLMVVWHCSISSNPRRQTLISITTLPSRTSAVR